MLANFIIYLCWQRFGNIVRKGWRILLITCKLLKYLYQQYNDSHFLFASIAWPCFSYELKAYNQSSLITTSGTRAEDSILLKNYFFQQMRSCVPISQRHRNLCILSCSHYKNSGKQKGFRCHLFEWTIPEVVRLLIRDNNIVNHKTSVI